MGKKNKTIIHVLSRDIIIETSRQKDTKKAIWMFTEEPLKFIRKGKKQKELLNE